MELLSRVKTSIFSAECWSALGKEYKGEGDDARAEICYLAAMYNFTEDKDLQRQWFNVYAENRIDKFERFISLQEALDNVKPAVELVNSSAERLQEELLNCLTYVETGRPVYVRK